MKFLQLLSPFLLGIALAGSHTYVQAQPGKGNFTFTWGEEYELPRRHTDLGFIGNAADGYVQIGHRDGETLSFQKFNKDLQLKGEGEVSLESLPRRYESDQIAQIGSKYYWFFNSFDKREDEESIFAQEIDLHKATTTGNAKKLASTTRIVDVSKWNFYYSFDHSKLLIEYRKKPERRNDRHNNDVIGFEVFDDNLKKLWSREIQMPYTEEMMYNVDYSIDSRGNVYLLAKIYDEKRSRDRKKPNYHFEVLKWSEDKKEVAIIPFKFTDKFVNSAYLTEDANGKLVAGGYYSNRRNSGSTDGIFLLRLDDETNEMNKIMKGIYPFPTSVMQQYENARTRRRLDRKAEKGEAEDENLVLREINLLPDGSIQVYGEEHLIITTTYRSGRTSYTVTTYYYNDIMAMAIGNDGEMKWVKKIPKAQSGNNGRGGMSYKSFYFNGDTYFFYMDNRKNSDLPLDQAPASHSDGAGGVLTAVRIEPSGKMTKAKVYDVREENINLKVCDFRKVSANQLMVRAGKRKHSQAALITFE